MFLSFGSLIATALPIGMAVFGLAVSISSMSLLAGVIDVPNWGPVLGAMVGLGVGIDYALFVVTRHRDYLARGLAVEDSVARAIATAGQPVVFAGGIVIVSVLGLAVAGVPFMTGGGIALAMVVAVMVAVSITLLPAFLGLSGHAINRFGFQRRPAADGVGWSRWVGHVTRHAWPYLIGVTALLLALAGPALALRPGVPDDGALPSSRTERAAHDLVAQGFGPGHNGPLVVAAYLDGDPGVVVPLVDALRADRGVASVAPANVNTAAGIASVVVFPTTGPQDEATRETVERLRAEVIPTALAGSPARAHVGGQMVNFADVGARVNDRLPLFIGAVLGLSFLLLMLVFRSVLVPLKAVALNLVSIGASYGVMVMVFQWGSVPGTATMAEWLWRSAHHFVGEQGVDGGDAAQGRFLDVLLRPMRDVEAAGAVPEGGNAELRVPAGVQAPGAQLVARGSPGERGDAVAEQLRGGVSQRRVGGRGDLRDLDRDLGARIAGRVFDGVGDALEFGVDVLFGVEAAVDGEGGPGGHDVEVRAAAGLSADHDHRAERFALADRVGGVPLAHLLRVGLERRGDFEHVQERVNALERLPDVDRAAMHVHAQGQGALGGVPDDLAALLGGHHRQSGRVDEVVVAQVARTDRAASLLVTDQVDDDATVAEQAELVGCRRAVEHADDAALHVGGAAADDRAVPALRGELRPVLDGHDVEVAVEVDQLLPVADGAAHDARVLDRAGRLNREDLRRQAEPIHLLAQQLGALGHTPSGRIVGLAGDQANEQAGHLLGAVIDPALYACGKLGHDDSFPFGTGWLVRTRLWRIEQKVLPTLPVTAADRGRMYAVDAIDRKILALLQFDGRLTITELAAQIGLSVSPCHRRLRELERSGAISGYRAIVDPEAVGLRFQALVFVTMRQEDRETLLGFERAITEIPQIVRAQRLFGDPDYLLRILTEDLGAYQRLEDDVLSALPGVQRLNSTLVMKQIVETTAHSHPEP